MRTKSSMKTTTNRISGATGGRERWNIGERQNIKRDRAPRHPGALLHGSFCRHPA